MYRINTNGTATFLYNLSGDLPPNWNTQYVWRAADNRIYGNDRGVVRGYNFATGAHEVTFNLFGWVNNFDGHDQNIAIADDVILTSGYYGIVNAWDFAGNKLGTSRAHSLIRDGFQSNPFSFANGLAWFNDQGPKDWLGYDLGIQMEPYPPKKSTGVSSVDVDLADNELISFVAGGKSYTQSDLIHPTLTEFSAYHKVTIAAPGGSVPTPGTRSQLLTHDFNLDTGMALSNNCGALSNSNCNTSTSEKPAVL